MITTFSKKILRYQVHTPHHIAPKYQTFSWDFPRNSFSLYSLVINPLNTLIILVTSYLRFTCQDHTPHWNVFSNFTNTYTYINFRFLSNTYSLCSPSINITSGKILLLTIIIFFFTQNHQAHSPHCRDNSKFLVFLFILSNSHGKLWNWDKILLLRHT